MLRIRLLFPAVLLVSACRPSGSPASLTPPWLIERGRQERDLAAKSPAFHDFTFTDHLASSGITFVNHIVDDAGRAYKAVHYDHGTGLCAADIDGDGLPDLYFVSQLGTSELWKNLGGGKFSNITADAGLNLPDAIAVACSFADIDNDGLSDLSVTTVRHGNHLFKNLGGGKFEDITQKAGVGYVGHSSGAVFFDYDGDGLLDLFVTNVGVYTTNEKGPGGYFVGLADAFHGHTHPERAEASILYHNLGGGRFKDVKRETGLVDLGWSGDATVIDVNDDGLPDLYILNMQGQNHLWLNEGGKHFRDATSTYFPKTPWGAMGVKAFDFNGDGRLDLLVTDMHSDMFDNVPAGDWVGETRKSDPAKMPPDVFPTGQSQFIFGNALFANRGVGTVAAGGASTAGGARVGGGAVPAAVYTDMSDSLGVETYWPWGPSVDDINADGWDDIFLTGGMNFPFRYSINSLLLNERGRHFLPSEFTLGVEPREGGATEQAWYTVECGDGGADRGSKSCEACAQPNAAALGCRRDAAGRLTMMGARGTRSAIILDLDGDGDLDIVTNEFNAAPRILISDLAARRRINFLKVRLRGTRSNRDGLGAQVTVVMTDDRRILKVMDGKSGYLSQSSLPLYFGLADADHAASIEIRWPSGRKQVVPGPIRANQMIDVVEP